MKRSWRSRLIGLLGDALARELTANFLKIRRDYATHTLERASPGKFVETFVQCLQRIATGSFDPKPDGDGYLGKHVKNQSALPDGLRLCAARIARSIYTLRNKRNIAHKNPIDPNTYYLAFVHEASAWIMAELVRCSSGITMEETGEVIELAQAPVGTLIEEIDGTRLVHAGVSVRGEILILLYSHYPEHVHIETVLRSLKTRNPGTVRNRLNDLRNEKLLHGDREAGYRLTQAGYAAAANEIQRLRQ